MKMVDQYNFSAGRDTVFIKEGDFNQKNRDNKSLDITELRELNKNILKLSEHISLPHSLNEYVDKIINNTASKQEKIEVKNFLETMTNRSSNMFKSLLKIKECDESLNWFLSSATPIITYLSTMIN